MIRLQTFLWSAGFMVATTVGAGLFALPYIFREAGWLTGLSYLLLLSVFLSIAHEFYRRILEKVKEKQRLLGLVRHYLGESAARVAFFVVIGGLILALVIYLILASQFIRLISPEAGFAGIALFWFLSSVAVFAKDGRFVSLELGGGVLMFFIILFIFFAAPNGKSFEGVPAFDASNFFLPFGAIIFALAGWTAVEPIFEFERKRGSRIPFSMIAGTVFSALLYLLFIVGIFNSGGEITSDTLSGLVSWPSWKLALLGWLGLLSLATSYIPISLEIRNALEKDLVWPGWIARGVVLFAPPLLLFMGLKNFIGVLSLAGGVFLSLQYLFILLIGRKILSLKPAEKLIAVVLILLFLAAALYEIYYFLY